ncbi:MAG: SRPBCC domain-containing protein [Gammaproteobacteria bacterium]
MKTFQAAGSIQAPAERVWALLIDVARWPAWNTTVDKVAGYVALGATVTVHTKLSPGRAFPVRVAELDAPRRMVWRGGMPLGLFTGTRTFTIAPHNSGSVEFDMREEFAGLFAPLIAKSIPDLKPAFNEFVRCLKAAAERQD